MARNNYGKGQVISNNASSRLHPALENLKERLSSPRPKAASTILTYVETSARFLSGLGKDREPTDTDFRRYFVRRRRQGISERTLRKEFFQLKKLALANSWPWPSAAAGTSEIILGRRRRTKASATANEAVNRLHPALENLVERLSSPRLRAPGTLTSYLVTGANFLSGLKDNQVPTDSDFRRYFIHRRQGGISERTLRKEFFHVKKLALANGWPWPFESDDAPYPEKEQKLPVLLQAEAEQLIKAQAKLSSAERFYLAVATTWMVRREDLCRIKKRDFDENVIKIQTSKHGKIVRAPIPDVLKPVFAAYRPKGRAPVSLSAMFNRMCAKADVQRPEGSGWHALRYTLTSVLAHVLPENRLDPALLADYSGWQARKLSTVYGGAEMIGYYRHPEIVDTDPYAVFKKIYPIHPFLKLWEQALGRKRAVKKG